MMREGWSIKTVGDLAEVFSGYAFKAKDLNKGDIPVLKIANIQNKKVNPQCIAYFDSKKLTSKLDKYFLQKNDFLIAMTGAGSVGKNGKMRNKKGKFLVNQRVGIVRPNHLVYPEFLFQQISQDKYESYMYQLGLGAGQPNISANDIKNMEINFIESIEEQQKIATILSNYDDLIENNLKRIELLEKIAKLVYDEWFVKFKFPGHEDVKMIEGELGMIPEGWEVKPVSELVKRLKAGKKYTQDNVFDEGNIPVVDQSTKDILGYHNDEPDHVASAHKPIMIFGDHTCKMQILTKPFSVGPNVIPLCSINLPESFIYYMINNLVSTKEYKRHWNELIVKKAIKPDENIAVLFAEKIELLLKQISILKDKILNLGKTRELLLPKLINGNVDVSRLDIEISEVEA